MDDLTDNLTDKPPQNLQSNNKLLMAIAIFGLTVFILAAATLPFKDKLFSQLFSKPASYAAEGVIRGQLGDFWADIELGKRDFTEISAREIVPNKVNAPGGVIVDRSVSPGRAYVWDSGNNRILGIDLATCYGQASACTADIIIGQSSGSDFGGCNQDSSFQDYPNRPPSSASTLCGVSESTHTTLEDKSFANMFVDSQGNLYVPDIGNNRVLKYDSPFTTDTVADEVWGQDDFTGNKCNKGGSPSASSLCFASKGADGLGVAKDASGNLWVADGGNNRVLRFPAGSRTADLVLGQSNFTSGGNDSTGSTMNRMSSPYAVRISSQGNLYVADKSNNRVLVFNPPFINGMSASGTIGSNLVEPLGLEINPSFGTTPSQSPSPTPTPTPPAASYKIFVTSNTYNGNLGGLTGADTKCQESAQVAGLGGIWKAWISDSTTSAASRLNHAEDPYQLVNGTVVASNWADLTDSSLAIPINITENGTYVPSSNFPWTWTNTLANGEKASSIPANNCQNWNSTLDTAYIGYTAFSDYIWTYGGVNNLCSNSLRLYCFQQALSSGSPIEGTPIEGIWILQNPSDQPGKISLWDFNGNLLNNLPAIGNPGGGSIGIDTDGNILATAYVYGQDVFRFSPNGSNYIQDKKLFASGGKYNATTSRRLEHPAWVGVTISGNQLIVADGRILFWNDSNSLTNGKAPDGYIGANSFTEIPGFEYVKADRQNHLFVPNKTEIKIYQTPLNIGASPIKTISSTVNVLGGGTINMIGVISATPTPDGSFLWVSEPGNHRVFRIKDPLTNPVVDVILGQTQLADNTRVDNGFNPNFDPNSTDFPNKCNRGEIMPPNTNPNRPASADASLNMLCFPGAISLDKRGNLYVSDHVIEAAGNWRTLMFSADLFPTSSSAVIFAPNASKEFPRNTSTNPTSHMNFEAAFDSTNRMVIGNNPYSGNRFVEFYHDPTRINSSNPDGKLNDFYGWPVAMTFDDTDNLYVYDANRGQVRIYKTPFSGYMPSPTPTPTASSSPTPSPNTFYNLSSTLCVDKATFNFNFSGISSSFKVDMGVNPDSFTTGSGIYFDFGTGTNSPIVVTNVSKMGQYKAGKNMSWRVKNTDGTILSPVQTATVSYCGPVAILNVASGTYLKGSKSVSINASDPQALGVSRAELLVDQIAVGSKATSPYNISWNTRTSLDGPHTLTAKVYYANGTSQTSSPINVTVDNTLPTVSITSPLPDANVSGTIAIVASASDNLGIKNVKFLIDGASKKTLSSPPYQYSWNSAAVLNGTHNLKVTVTDKAGNVSSTVDVPVNVQN